MKPSEARHVVIFYYALTYFALGGHDYVSVNTTLSARLPLSENVCECVVVRHDQVVEATETFTMQLAISHPLVNTGGRVATVMLRDNSLSGE